MTLSSIFGIGPINLVYLFLWTFGAAVGVPGAIVLIVSLGAIAENIPELMLVMFTVAVAAALGDYTSYEIGKRITLSFKKFLAKLGVISEERKLSSMFRNSEFWLVFLTRFIFIGACTVVSYLSGWNRMERKKFLAAMIPGEILYAIIFPLIGFLFKQIWNDLTIIINDLTFLTLLAILIWIVVKLALIKNKNRKLSF